jgi:metallo-beta-lactamase family protein
MKITPLGAAGGEVTGSCYLVETERARVLVDCGLFQGGKETEIKNRLPAIVRPAKLDAVVVTHGHLDHTGRLPLLGQAGFRGPIFATPATIELASLIVRDAAKVQAQDIERTNRKRLRAGKKEVRPLYTPDDAETIIQSFKTACYGQAIEVAPGIRAIWAEAGHMLGSASVQLLVEEEGRTKRIVFSGDLGPIGAPILRDFEPFHEADLVFLESTYGDRDHRAFVETVDEFVSVVREAVAHRGKKLIPTFAVGRAQLITLLVCWMFREKKVQKFPVFLDSPMAIEASRIYSRHPELFDDQINEIIHCDSLAEDLGTLQATATAEQSRRINDVPGPCLVMAGAGMCNAGRILHHLKHNLWSPSTHVIIVGYQSHGSLGRRLVDGEKVVSVHGEKIAVRAQIHTLGGFSAHAGQTDLLCWFNALGRSRPRVVLTHGEDGPRRALAAKIQQQYHLTPLIPALGEVIEA